MRPIHSGTSLRGALVRLVLVFALLCAGSAWAENESIPELSPEVVRKAAARSFDAQELAGHAGADPAKPLLMAVRGVVFDVSSGSRFYGAGALYNALIGLDSSRAVARMSLDPADLNDECDALDAAQWQFLAQVFRDTYLAKYPVVGHFAGGYFFPDGLCCSDAGCGACDAASATP